LFPRQASADRAEQVRLTNSGLSAIAALMTPLIGLGIFGMEPFLRLWIGGDFYVVAAPIGEIALIGFWANAMAYVPFAQLEARGKARIGAFIHLLELPGYLAALYLLMKNFGLPGAAAAFSIRCIVDAIAFNRLCLGGDALWIMPIRSMLILTASLFAVGQWHSFTPAWWVALIAFMAAAIWNSVAVAPIAVRHALLRAIKRTPARAARH
jgi:hypothetical protein